MRRRQYFGGLTFFDEKNNICNDKSKEELSFEIRTFQENQQVELCAKEFKIIMPDFH